MKNVKKVMIALMPFVVAISGAAASGLNPNLNVNAQYRPNNDPAEDCMNGVTEQENCSTAAGQQCTIANQNGELAFEEASLCLTPLNFN